MRRDVNSRPHLINLGLHTTALIREGGLLESASLQSASHMAEATVSGDVRNTGRKRDALRSNGRGMNRKGIRVHASEAAVAFAWAVMGQVCPGKAAVCSNGTYNVYGRGVWVVHVSQVRQCLSSVEPDKEALGCTLLDIVHLLCLFSSRCLS